MDYVKLNNGVEMPILGFWCLSNTKKKKQKKLF